VQRLSLGLEATSSGLIQARRELKRVSQALRQKRFDWSDWGRAQGSTSGLERLKAFEGAFFADPRRRRNPAGSRTTWTAAYQPYVRRLRVLLEQGEPLTSALLVQVLEAYPPASRSRQQCGTALAALAKQLELPLPEDWRERASGYGLHQAQYRRLPSDAQLLEWVERIPNPRWRMVYGLMATYGLRNHEVFFADLSALAPGEDRVIRVLPTTKTGEHQVWPFQPEWVDRFELAPARGAQRTASRRLHRSQAHHPSAGGATGGGTVPSLRPALHPLRPASCLGRAHDPHRPARHGGGADDGPLGGDSHPHLPPLDHPA
jgi:hypothetical protein